MINARCPLLLAVHGNWPARSACQWEQHKKLPSGVHAVVCKSQWCVGPAEWCSSEYPTLLVPSSSDGPDADVGEQGDRDPRPRELEAVVCVKRAFFLSFRY
jgi:hypothetical protein